MKTRQTSREARVRHLPSLALHSLVGAALTIGMAACSVDERTPGAPSPSSQSPAPEAMSAPDDTNAAMPGEGQPSEDQSGEMPALPSLPEGQTTNVGLTPTSMDNAMPPVTEPPAPPETNEPAADGSPVPSAGCGSTQAVQDGRLSIDVAGATRQYILEVPDDYDATRPYRLIFGWHWRGGNAQQVADGFYGLEERAEGSAIFVSAEGIDAGWANTDGRDLAFLDAMLARIQGDLCIDQSRIFSTGWSYGGMMTLAVGCARADVFRAIAPMSGATYSGCEDGNQPVAFLGYHGNNDDVVPYGNGVAARDIFVERNGCQPESAAVEANGCLEFEGCTEGAPLTWCEFNGGHMPGPGSEQAIWDFFSQF
jgi:polyhydroxybutyrate depolymerase